MENYYKPHGCPVHGVVNEKTETTPKLGIDQKRFNEIAKTVTKETVIQPDLFVYTNKIISGGVDKVFGSLRYDDKNFAFAQKLKRNTARFSGYKTAWQTTEIKEAEAKELPTINKNNNTNYLRTEYVHTVRTVRSAKNWQVYEDDKDLYPFLEYMPSAAAEPRSDHRKLYGVIKSVDDVFWDVWLPPSAWGCQCSVAQRQDNEKGIEPPFDVEHPQKMFRNNAGKTGKIFTDEHPMIAGVKSEKKRKAIDREYQYLERKQHRKESLNYIKKQFAGKYFMLKADKEKIKTTALSTNSIKEIINQPTSNYLTKNEIATQLDDIIKDAEFLFIKESTKPKFESFYYFKVKGFDFMLNIGKRHNGEFVIHSLTNTKKPA